MLIMISLKDSKKSTLSVYPNKGYKREIIVF